MKNAKKELPEEPFDPDTERPAESDELDFSNDEEPSFADLSVEDNLEQIQGRTSTQTTDNSDDLEPEDLIKEDGARSPHEHSMDIPADVDLSIVDVDEIGAGYGLDEAELARVKPLNNTIEKRDS